MRYKITALTPLLVGDGKELSPVDYMVWKDQVNVLDQTRIFRLLARGPRLEGYLTQLRKATKLDFASWGGFAQNFSQRRIPFENAEAAALWNNAPPESLFIPTFASDHRGVYLPASAWKGALRTGLVSSRWNAQTIQRMADGLEGDRVPRRLAEAAESAAGASQVRLIAGADSDPVPASSLKIYLTRVASMDTRQGSKPQLVWKVPGRGSVPTQRINEATPLFAEMASPGTSFSGTWSLRTALQNPEDMRALGWRSVPELKTILEACNNYAAAQLDVHANFAQSVGLGAVLQNIERLRVQLETVRSNGTGALLCLGWGGGFVSKAAHLDTAEPGYRTLLRAVPALSKGIRDGVVFPKTRRVVFQGGQPGSFPGWVSAEFSQ
jgi:CRISPR-associated protein Csm5